MPWKNSTLRKRVLELHRRETFAWITFGAVVLVISLLHLFNNGLNIDHKEIWGDEASTFIQSQYPLGTVLTVPTKVHSQPPLYYILLHFTSQLGSSEAALRSVSWSLCLGLIYFVLFGLNELSILARVLFCSLFIFNDFTLYLAQELRPYSLAACLSLISSVLFARLVDGPRTRGLLATYVVVTTAMLYSLAFDVWVFAAHGLYSVGLIAARAKRDGVKETLRSHAGMIGALAVVSIAYIPYTLLVTKYHINEGKPSLAGSLRDMAKASNYAEILGKFTQGWGPISLVMFAVALYGLARQPRSKVPLWILLLFGQIAFAYGFLSGRLYVLPRYATPAFPILLLLFAMGAEQLLQLKPKPRFLWLTSLLTLGALAAREAPAFAAYLRAPVPAANWRRLYAEMKKIPGKKAIFFRTGNYSVMLGYLARRDKDITFLAGTTYEPAPPGLPITLGGDMITKRYVDAMLAKHRESTRCFFYSQDKRLRGKDAIFEDVFVPAMKELHYDEVFHLASGDVPDPYHDYYDVRGYCRR